MFAENENHNKTYDGENHHSYTLQPVLSKSHLHECGNKRRTAKDRDNEIVKMLEYEYEIVRFFLTNYPENQEVKQSPLASNPPKKTHPGIMNIRKKLYNVNSKEKEILSERKLKHPNSRNGPKIEKIIGKPSHTYNIQSTDSFFRNKNIFLDTSNDRYEKKIKREEKENEDKKMHSHENGTNNYNTIHDPQDSIQIFRQNGFKDARCKRFKTDNSNLYPLQKAIFNHFKAREKNNESKHQSQPNILTFKNKTPPRNDVLNKITSFRRKLQSRENSRSKSAKKEEKKKNIKLKKKILVQKPSLNIETDETKDLHLFEKGNAASTARLSMKSPKALLYTRHNFAKVLGKNLKHISINTEATTPVQNIKTFITLQPHTSKPSQKPKTFKTVKMHPKVLSVRGRSKEIPREEEKEEKTSISKRNIIEEETPESKLKGSSLSTMFLTELNTPYAPSPPKTQTPFKRKAKSLNRNHSPLHTLLNSSDTPLPPSHSMHPTHDRHNRHDRQNRQSAHPTHPTHHTHPRHNRYNLYFNNTLPDPHTHSPQAQQHPTNSPPHNHSPLIKHTLQSNHINIHHNYLHLTNFNSLNHQIKSSANQIDSAEFCELDNPSEWRNKHSQSPFDLGSQDKLDSIKLNLNTMYSHTHSNQSNSNCLIHSEDDLRQSLKDLNYKLS